MKFIVFNSFVIIGLFAIFTSCINPAKIKTKVAPENNSTKKKGPGRIVFDKEIHNFGTLKDGEVLSYSFRYRNTGGSPVKIIGKERDCGCIELNYSEEAVSPGDSSTVEIILNTSGEWGNLIKEVTVVTSEGERKKLKISAYIDNKQFNNFLNTQK
jgi:hypothetical protein